MLKLMVPQRLDKCYDGVVIFLDFHSTKYGLLLVDSWSRGLDLKQVYPDRDAFVPRSGIHYSTLSKNGGKWRDRRRTKHCPSCLFFCVNKGQ